MPMATKISGIVLLLLALLLTGCGGEIVADLYIQDIYEIAEGVEEPMFTTATIALESLGEEYNAELIELIELNFRQTANFRTQSRDFSTYLLADVKIPVLDLEDSDDLWIANGLLGIVVLTMEDGSLAFGIGLNGDKFLELSSSFGEDSWQGLSIKDFTIGVKLINDLRDPVLVSLQSVYANQVPLAYDEMYELQRRDILDIQLADVLRDYAFEEGIVFFGILEN
jgi:hypothetical protein